MNEVNDEPSGRPEVLATACNATTACHALPRDYSADTFMDVEVGIVGRADRDWEAFLKILQNSTHIPH